MAGYQWTFASVGGATRVRIQSGEDIRHLGELDQKMWTVLSCPTTGLEIPEDTLRLMDFDNDGKIRVTEIVQTAQWLTGVLQDADTLLEKTDTLRLDGIHPDGPDATVILETARQIAGERETICLADVEAFVEKLKADTPAAEEQPLPAAPYDEGIMAACRAHKADYDGYFETRRLEQLGLAVTDPETAPKIEAAAWEQYEKTLDAYDAEVAAVQAANQAAAEARAAAMQATIERYQPLIRLLKLKRWFFPLLHNFVTLEDFYARDAKGIFQCGTLIIDQRACQLCIRISDAAAMSANAGLSGMYLLFCDCTSRSTGKQLSIVAAVTQGEVNDLFVGKNAIFYDRNGLDYDARVTKIIDNPISIRQAFWSPYRKFFQWLKDLINKSAVEKDNKSVEGMKTVTTSNIENAKAEMAQAKEQPTTAPGTTPVAAAASGARQAFDIAKFAGIFAAIGMALGYIGAFFVSLGKGISNIWDGGQGWYSLLLVIIALMLCISGPSMFLAWTKLRSRNLAPILNANGWAINARSLVSVPFGLTLTQMAHFPLLPGQKKRPAWQKWLIGIVAVGAIGIVLWIFNLLAFCGMQSPLHAFSQPTTEQVSDTLQNEPHK